MARKRVTIVVYHDPSPEALDRHLAYLTAHYRAITLDRLAEALHSGDWAPIPAYAFVVTVDDGHRGNSRLTAVFARHGVSPTLYLCSGIVATRRAFWFHVSGAATDELKRLPNAERLSQLRDRFGFTPTSDTAEARALSAADLDAMQATFDFGAHTRFHPILTTCEAAECEAEIRGSREDLEVRFEVPCAHFSYPNGDYTDREVEMARAAGFRSARTTDVGWNGPHTDPYKLRVTGVTDDASINMLAVQVSGIIAYLRCLLDGSFTGATRKHLLRTNQ